MAPDGPREDNGRGWQLKVLQAISAAQKLRIVQRLYGSARRLKESHARAVHPNWSETRIRRHVSDAFLYRRD